MPEHRTTIVLAPVGGTCTIVTQPDTVRARRRDTIVWVVQNNCDVSMNVSLVDFRNKGTGQADDPTDGSKQTSAPRPGSADIRADVRGNAAGGTYTYEVRVGGLTADPEIVVDIV